VRFTLGVDNGRRVNVLRVSRVIWRVPFRSVQLRLVETQLPSRSLAIETNDDHLRQGALSVGNRRSGFDVNKRIENEVRNAV
jgi:hypothetical protein